MYSEETTTIDNLSVFNRPATLTEEQVINNIAVSLEDTINLARAAKEAGFGDIMKHSRITSLINFISDSANEKTSKQMEALLATLHDISGKMDIMEERQDGVEALATFLELSGAFTHDGKPRHNTAHQIPNPDNPEDNADDDDIDSLSVDSVPTSQPPSDYG
ncbi:hypothetical protein D9619_001714 [Psilocybe cf. subviscida]|uniref:Uncharacterized protein n=1 Tax=Psilocybe cf. subviscida TaxID=2480587 RepID=A0A8H5BFE5_9AGAR|nr:hypothetical protein D9619_001714 [Psilocybe cf. subviscida]